jgi:hypothetical protein
VSSEKTRRILVAFIAAGMTLQAAAIVWAVFSKGAPTAAEEMAPFTYLLSTMASVPAGIMAVAGSVLILSMTLGSPVQRSHLGAIVLKDPDFRLSQAGAVTTILACCLALLLSHLPFVSHSATSLVILAFGGYLQFGAVLIALVRLFRTIPTLLTQERLLDSALGKLDAAYLAGREQRLLGVDATERGRSERINDLIFAFRIAPGEADDPLVTVHDVLENVVSQSPPSVVTYSLNLVSRKLADVIDTSHDRICQLLVTPWFSELRVPVVRRASPSVALTYFDAWANLLRAAREKGMDGFVANSARSFVGALKDVARGGLFESATDRALRPLARLVSEIGENPAVAGPWMGAVVIWMREDAERGDGAYARVLWNPVERYVSRLARDLNRETPVLAVLIHALTAVVRASVRQGLVTESGDPFEKEISETLEKIARELRIRAEDPNTPREALVRARKRAELLLEPVEASYPSAGPETKPPA